jgi:hypothetical protein
MERIDASGMKAGLTDLGHSWLLSTDEQVNSDIYQELLRQDVVPWVKRMYTDKKYDFQQIQLGSTPPGPPK